MKRSYFFLISAIGCWLIPGCSASIPQISASGEIAGQKITTTVDSEIARYYLESYLQNHRSNAAIDSIFDDLHNAEADTMPGREFLQHLSEKFSVDFAALFLAKHILESNTNRKFEAAYRRELASARRESGQYISPSNGQKSSYIFLFVPGWDYVSAGPITGADFASARKIATEMGIENYLVNIKPTGIIEENARILAAEINHPRYAGRKIILASASSGGPVAALALGELLSPHDVKRVNAWVNIGGILQGSPVVDHYLSWPKSWLGRIVLLFKGWGFDSIRSMSVAESRQRFHRLNFPENLLIVNYIGIPLSGDISKRAEHSYPILRKFGPNDGFTLITDEMAPNSITITEIGRDHFFNEDPEIDLKTIALVKTILNAIQKDGALSSTQ